MFNYNYGDFREGRSTYPSYQADTNPSDTNAKLDQLDLQISEIRQGLVHRTSLPLDASQIQPLTDPQSLNPHERLNQLNLQIADIRAERLAETRGTAFLQSESSPFIVDSRDPQLPTYDQSLPQREESFLQTQDINRLQQLIKSIPTHTGMNTENLQKLTHDLSEARKNMELQIAQLRETREQLNHLRETREQLNHSHYPKVSQTLSDFFLPSDQTTGDESDEIHSPRLRNQSSISQNDYESFFQLSESEETVPELEEELQALYKKEQLEQREAFADRKRTAQQAFPFSVPPIEELSEEERKALEDRSHLRPTKRARASSFQPTKRKPIHKIKISEWNYEEVESLKEGVSTYGPKWDLIARDCLKGNKTAIECETYFKSLQGTP